MELKSADQEIGVPGTQGIKAEAGSTNADREIGAPGTQGIVSIDVYSQ